jgi:hypothetical protein
MPTRRALLLIADIGGYTEYMQFHRSVLGHAEAATSRMLDKIIRAAPGFKLIEVEGDAAFVSRDASGLDGHAAMAVVSDAVVAMHRAFHAERRYVELNMCPCGSCTQTNGLTLKFVAHVGEVATQTIRRREKLVGVDVIYVHRLLKNPVQVPEYLLVSDELLGDGPTAVDAPVTQEVAMDLEGIGPVRTHVVDVADLAPPATVVDPTWPQRIGGTFAMVGRGLPHVLRRRRPQVLGAVG